ncbi:hypothetical protein WDW89_21065 [Deltaproteobacteria bacterium TL4]
MLRLFFDVDGVLLDFESRFIRVIKNYFSLDISDNYQSNSWDFTELLTPAQLIESWEYFLSSEHFGTLDPLVDPVMFNEVYGAYPVHFITNIPPDYLEVRRMNLLHAGFQFESIHCGGMLSFDDKPPCTKGEMIQNIRQKGETIFFVDDHPDNCVNVHTLCPQSIVWLMSRSFNQGFEHPEIRRAEHWNEVFAFSKELAGTFQ